MSAMEEEKLIQKLRAARSMLDEKLIQEDERVKKLQKVLKMSHKTKWLSLLKLNKTGKKLLKSKIKKA